MPTATVFIWLTLKKISISTCVVMKLLMWFSPSQDPFNKFLVGVICLPVCQLGIHIQPQLFQCFQVTCMKTS